MTKSNEVIKFFFNGVQFVFRERRKLKKFLEFIFKSEKKPIGSLLYVFSTDKHVLSLNRKYLNHDYETDILTFPPTQDGPAEVYISIDRVRENARIYETSFKEELLRVIFHGALHLCGHKDKDKKQQIAMRKKEDHYLKLFQCFT